MKRCLKSAPLVVLTVLVAGALSVVTLTGCAKTLTQKEFTEKFSSNRIDSACTGRYYIGTANGFHYFHEEWADWIPDKDYRVAEGSLAIKDPFPLTSDRSRWRAWSKPVEGR